MLRKLLLSIPGFGLGAFMLFNSLVVVMKIRSGTEWHITPEEKMASAIITGVVGGILVLWTYLLIKKDQGSTGETLKTKP
ncbi:MAG: hypothetical protein S4CHLAM102_02380 [Chlamydiia bacterium]|nr:hypothetical protein [Chlamydiia bacterium]